MTGRLGGRARRRGTITPDREQSEARMRARGVHHVAINVSDVPEAVDFYVDVLGLSSRDDRPDIGIDGAWLDAGGQQVHLLEAPMPTAMGQHFALHVDDIDATVAELRGRGLAVSDPSSIGPDRQAFLQDPSGNSIELHEVGSGVHAS
jgi:catechol 2,3-dioxygenase-like lactoylglutathione lyase family enzyme